MENKINLIDFDLLNDYFKDYKTTAFENMIKYLQHKYPNSIIKYENGNIVCKGTNEELVLIQHEIDEIKNYGK